jgi:hypothetical protein
MIIRVATSILFLLSVLAAFSTGCSQPDAGESAVTEAEVAPVEPDVNTLTPDEIAEGWELLFDGQSLERWRGFKMDEVPPDWVVQEGTLHFQGEHGGEGHGDLMTREQFDNFELRLEWKVAPGANSGILYRVTEDYEQEFMTGPEFQIIDGSEEFYPELEDGQKVGADYALHPASKDASKPVGEWNTVRLVVNGAHVEHWLNGEKIVEFELWTDEWKEKVSQTKFADWPDYGLNKSGYIVLQDHGAPVWFRNLKIKRLS